MFNINQYKKQKELYINIKSEKIKESYKRSKNSQ